MVEIKAPQFPESIADGQVATWHVAVGDGVKRDQLIVDIETDKVVIDVVAQMDGTITAIHKEEGETVLAEELLGEMEPGEVADAPPNTADAASAPEVEAAPSEEPVSDQGETIASPAAKKMADENQIDVTKIEGSGKGGSRH